jgi:hypothetical protein
MTRKLSSAPEKSSLRHSPIGLLVEQAPIASAINTGMMECRNAEYLMEDRLD